MKHNRKISIIIYLLFFSIFFFNNVYAGESKKFLSLKNNKVNLRSGPSKDYPVKLIYKKKFLPVQVLDSWENWRKIMDYENNSGWIHVSLLSGKKSAINNKRNSILFKSDTIYSEPLAKIEMGRLLLIKKCSYNWCKVATGKYVGWVFKNSLWGNIK